MADEDKPAALQVASVVSPEGKIPPFWRQDPELWFSAVEQIFARCKISNSLSKFQLVVPKLEFDILQQAADILKRPSAEPYEDLKKRLIETFSESENRRIMQLLEGKQLGDLKPSQLLRQMRQLAGTSASEEMLKPLWLRNLPPSMHAILSATEEKSLDKLAVVADRVHDIQQPVEVSAVSTSADRVSRLEAQIEALSTQVAELVKLQRSGQQQRQRSTRSRSASRGRRADGGLCFYHNRFGDKARKCEGQCSWDSSKDGKK